MSVSLALRNDPSVSKELRDKVHATAAALGYSRDPKVSALMDHIRTRSKKDSLETIAVIRWGNHSDGFAARIYKGMVKHAPDLSFELQCFDRHRLSWERISSILTARNIQGVAILPPALDIDTDAFEWSRFVSVVASSRPSHSALNRIATNNAQCIATTLKAITEAGYKRPGFLIDEQIDQFQNYVSTAHFQRLVQLYKIGEPTGLSYTNASSTALKQWFKSYKPDVIIKQSALSFSALFQKIGIGASKRIAYCDCDLDTESVDHGVAGIRRNCSEIGKTVALQLFARLQQNERGLPQYPHEILIPGTWVRGTSLPDQAR